MAGEDRRIKRLIMIGIIAKESEKKVVEEFFELFKTPWEFYQDNIQYDVVLSTTEIDKEINTKLLIIYGSEKTRFDHEHKIGINSWKENQILEYNGGFLPVYGKVMAFVATKKPLLRIKGTGETAEIEIDLADKKIIRIGFNLFQEISFLLSSGQPVEYSYIPTLELHIAILRDLILNSGIPLVEIPPVPAGYNFFVCLTHDVDFIGIRDHRFDRSVIGFIFRVIFLRYLRGLNSKVSWSKFIKNWKALLSLPGVYVGIFRDFWFDIDRYMEIEKGMCSTFFFIPFKNNPGATLNNKQPEYRAARYDINDYKALINALIREGHEIGLHGIDAWHDSEKGFKEHEAIHQISGEGYMGVRMHWLYFSEDSPKALEEAGFLYDSTVGYNDAVGFRSGTTQVFRLPRSSNIFELPLNVMDTALFYSKRMGISESKALDSCKKLISEMRTYGGVLTINWHTRSLSPERNWDDFYIELLEMLKAENVWFATATQAVHWFNNRRSIHFEDVKISDNKIRLKINSNNHEGLPHFLLRVHYPNAGQFNAKNSTSCKQSFVDIPWFGESEIEHTLEPDLHGSVNLLLMKNTEAANCR